MGGGGAARGGAGGAAAASALRVISHQNPRFRLLPSIPRSASRPPLLSSFPPSRNRHHAFALVVVAAALDHALIARLLSPALFLPACLLPLCFFICRCFLTPVAVFSRLTSCLVRYTSHSYLPKQPLILRSGFHPLVAVAFVKRSTLTTVVRLIRRLRFNTRAHRVVLYHFATPLKSHIFVTATQQRKSQLCSRSTLSALPFSHRTATQPSPETDILLSVVVGPSL